MLRKEAESQAQGQKNLQYVECSEKIRSRLVYSICLGFADAEISVSSGAFGCRVEKEVTETEPEIKVSAESDDLTPGVGDEEWREPEVVGSCQRPTRGMSVGEPNRNLESPPEVLFHE